MYFLIDTNVFIQLEDSQIIHKEFTKFSRLCNEHSATILIHPLSKKEIEKDRNNERRNVLLSKINRYKLIERPPLAEREELENSFGTITKSNDQIDCQFLYALKKHVVSFLITEDIGIHQRVKKKSLKNKVLTINQANNMMERLFPEHTEVLLPKVEDLYLYNLNNENTIFDSLKIDYTDFKEWFQKSSEKQVKAWVVKPLSKLESVCIYKEAKEKDYKSYSLPQKSLKLATFKVDESHRGKKLGELMLKQAFLYVIENNFKACWMTVFPKHKVLIDFIKDFGFDEIGETGLKDKQTNEQELVFQKTFIKPDKPRLKGLDYHIKYYPLVNSKNKKL